ncbi:MAG: DUF2071 domain-containing protein [Pirellulales bacterium]
MSSEPQSSEAADASQETQLAVLVACHHRGPLTAADLAKLLPATDAVDAAIGSLVEQGHLVADRHAFVMTQPGRNYLDGVLESIQGQLTPDDPAYVARYRQAKPSLPFAANTVWEHAICANVRVRPEALRPLIPPQFDLDLHDGWAYVSLTASRLKDFGAGPVPRALRKNFYQATYRAHVVFTDFRGRKSRGCYFVRSETNSQIMSLVANLLPEFKAHHCSTYPILMARQGDHLLLSVDSGDDPAGKVVLVLDAARPLDRMPDGSCFRSIDEAYSFIVDFYDAFSYDPRTNEVFILGIERGDWHIQVLEPVDYYLGYIAAGPLAGHAELDSVFYFRDTPYRWLPLLKERTRR